MTPTEKLQQKMVHMMTGETVADPSRLDARLKELDAEYEVVDTENELRCSGVPTGLPCDYSRHYESKSVAAEMLDGSWVGWTYWHGGGKHGEPELIPWMEDAYEVETWEEMQPVRKFKFKGESSSSSRGSHERERGGQMGGGRGSDAGSVCQRWVTRVRFQGRGDAPCGR